MMKLRLPPCTLLGHPNPYRTVPGNTLHLRHRNSLHFRCPHLPRRKLRMTHPKHACQRCILLLYLHLPSHWPRTLLWILPL
uniref:Uncharacterized protein n=1 Tax=Seriola dumerili TaxID=41447 RepID=A0A3B4V6J4_SERDU